MKKNKEGDKKCRKKKEVDPRDEKEGRAGHVFGREREGWLNADARRERRRVGLGEGRRVKVGWMTGEGFYLEGFGGGWGSRPKPTI